MKESVGELNSLVVVVISIGIFAIFFFSYIWPMMDANFNSSSSCSTAICEPCEATDTEGCKTVTCYTEEDYADNDKTNPFQCSYKG